MANSKESDISRSLSEQMCERVDRKIKEQAITLANAVLTMQKKIEQQIPIYEKMPLAQQVTVGTGESMLRANPATQEFRATVRDYAQALNNLQNILDNREIPNNDIPSLDEMRKRFKIAK